MYKVTVSATKFATEFKALTMGDVVYHVKRVCNNLYITRGHMPAIHVELERIKPFTDESDKLTAFPRVYFG